jgi:hypothetical protein
MVGTIFVYLDLVVRNELNLVLEWGDALFELRKKS